MEKFIQISAKALAQLRSGFNYFLEEKVQANSTNSILFLLSFFVLFLLSFSLILGFPNIAQILIIIAFLAVVMLVVLIGLAIYYESNRHLTKGHHNFKIEPINKNRIRFDLIQLDKASQKEFIRLMKGKRVNQRINFTMGNKSGDSANHKILFVLFDELLVGGIQDLAGERKQYFFDLLMESFLMNNTPLKASTLKTSFSAWKGDQEKINSRNQRKLIKQVLRKD